MTTLIEPDIVALWLVDEVPVRLVWRGERWRASDEPTRIGSRPEDLWHPALTHPVEPWTGWRLQATSARGETLMFEVRRAGDGAWHLLRAFD